MLADPEPRSSKNSQNLNPKNRLRLSMLEFALIGAMLLAIAVVSVDALDGQTVGKNNALEMAKQQAKQEFMALVQKSNSFR